jgi:membrane-associated protease RseP (regulator of RpoE activity)
MAQAMAEQLRRQPDSLVVAILGAGHVRHGHGVAHQLKDLGIHRIGALITWDRAEGCGRLAAGMADGVYVVEPPAQPQPRLGVAMGADADGVRITAVDGGSVAEQAGLKGGDLVVEIAGRPARTLDALRAAVQRQPAGTWLPLKVKRGGETLEIVARFPPNP